MKASKIPRTELNTVHLYQNYSLFMYNKLQYIWRGDYCDCVRPAQLPVLSSSSVPPGTMSTIRSPPGASRIQQGVRSLFLNVGTYVLKVHDVTSQKAVAKSYTRQIIKCRNKLCCPRWKEMGPWKCETDFTEMWNRLYFWMFAWPSVIDINNIDTQLDATITVY